MSDAGEEQQGYFVLVCESDDSVSIVPKPDVVCTESVGVGDKVMFFWGSEQKTFTGAVQFISSNFDDCKKVQEQIRILRQKKREASFHADRKRHAAVKAQILTKDIVTKKCRKNELVKDSEKEKNYDIDLEENNDSDNLDDTVKIEDSPNKSENFDFGKKPGTSNNLYRKLSDDGRQQCSPDFEENFFSGSAVLVASSTAKSEALHKNSTRKESPKKSSRSDTPKKSSRSDTPKKLPRSETPKKSPAKKSKKSSSKSSRGENLNARIKFQRTFDHLYKGIMFRKDDIEETSNMSEFVKLIDGFDDIFCEKESLDYAETASTASIVARRLLSGVYTKQALAQCSLTALPPRGKGRDAYAGGQGVKKMLHPRGVSAIIKYALQRQQDCDWHPKQNETYIRAKIGGRLCEISNEVAKNLALSSG